MDDLLPIDEVTRLFNLIKRGLQVAVPRVEPLVGELLPLIDGHDARKSINLRSNPPIHDHVSQLVLGALDGDTHELTHPRQRDSAVVAFNDAQVVLDELPDQLDHVVLAVQSSVLERLKGRHLLSDVVLLERHQFKCQELPHILREELVLLEFARVHSLNQVELVDLLLCVW